MPGLCCWRSALAMLAASCAMACPASAQYAPPSGQRGPQQAPAAQGVRPGYPAAGQVPQNQGVPVQGMQHPGAQAPAAQGGGSRQQVPMPPRPQAPFQLSQAEFEQLFQVLKVWEAQGDRVETMRADLVLFTEDRVFNQKSQQRGHLEYAKPDKGLYRVFDEEGKNTIAHWMCDGQSIYEYKHDEQKLIERTLPPELQGQGIANGPMPFLLGAKADQLLQRYYLRLVTPQELANSQIWIEAYPKYQQDAANFRRATVILIKETMQLDAVELYEPNGKQRTVHKLVNVKVNDRLNFIRGADFKATLPRGWTKVVNPEGVPGGPTAQRVAPPGEAPAQQR
jgi:TIGR03009 family protein